MTNPMAQSEPVEQRFQVPGTQADQSATAAEVPVQSINGTDIQEFGSLAAIDVLEALKDVIDPELGINIVDLGLVYGIVINAEDEVRLDMTLTSAACPLTDVIERQAQVILSSLTPHVRINWVWMPPWGPDRITEDGREQLRAIGFNV
ncbi:metal-sulfur cluster assembly factor [Schaalia sp. ZJ405]|uniref:metal-sulfur cluster assembly factor n=1 Tax=unclassified Schaalia TaxID=2691889 RepID=UPI0013EBA32F|nr:MULTISPECIES: metal-sulfur cluster assembly factor [unclassified Schaalia]QPK82047.1 metal-sulfur cluster assembly factor [Schaalia sp. ZJ405]